MTTIPKAQETGRLEVVTEATVTTIEVDANGRVSGVNYVKGGMEYFQPADVVLLASYVYENVRAAAAVEVEGVSERACRTITARWAGTTSATTRARRSPRSSRAI